MIRKTTTKATIRKARAVLALLDQPGARLLLMGQEHAYVLAGQEHVYACSAVYELLQSQAWIRPPAELGESGILASGITAEGRAMLTRWQCSNGASYTQLLFEEIQDFIMAEAQAVEAAKQAQARAAAGATQPGLFE